MHIRVREENDKARENSKEINQQNYKMTSTRRHLKLRTLSGGKKNSPKIMLIKLIIKTKSGT